MEAELLRRIERLERQDRRLKLAGGAALLGIAAVLVVGQAKPTVFDVVEARAFVLKNSKGETVGNFSVEEPAGLYPGLHMEVGEGTSRRSVSLNPTLLALSDFTQEENQIMAVTAGHFDFTSDGNRRVEIAGNDKQAFVSVLDRSGRVRAVLGDYKLARAATEATEDTGPGSLVLFDKDGKVIFREPR